MATRRWATALLAVGGLLACAILGVATPGGARATATTNPPSSPPDMQLAAGGDATSPPTLAAAGPPRLILEQQSAWVVSGDEFSARLQLPPGHGVGHLDVSVYGALDDPAQVAVTGRGEELPGSRRKVTTIQVASSDAASVVRVPIGSTRGAVNLAPGVYPLLLELSSDTLDQPVRLVTHVVVMSSSGVRHPRTVGVVAKIDQPFTWTSDGRLDVVGDPDLLFRNTAPLREHPQLAFTLMVTPGTLTALAGSPAGSRSYAALVGLAAQSQVANAPFSPLSAGAWAAARLDESLVEQFANGESALTSAIGRAPTGNTWVTSATDNTSVLRWLGNRGVRLFLVPDTLTPAPPDAPFRLNDVEMPHVALRLESFRPAGTPADGVHQVPGVLDAHELLARLAIPVVNHPDETPAPAAIILDDLSDEAQPYLRAVLDGVSQPGPLAPRSADTVLGELSTEHGHLSGWNWPTPKTVDLGTLGAEIDAVHAASASFQSSVGRDDPVVAAIHRAVLALPSVSSAERTGLVAAVQDLVRRELGTVEMARDQPITVTAHHAELPITVRNRGPRNLTVSFEVSSSDLEIRGPRQRTLKIDAGGTVDVVVPVGVYRSGDFRLLVRVATADGQVSLADGALTVRSTAISGVGVVLSLGALAFLAVWWVRHIRRTRQARRQAAASAPQEAEPSRIDEPVR